MELVFKAGSFILGLIVGSFLNVVVYRLKLDRSILGHSACLACRHRLGPYDLVPVASFVFLGGRCRYCQARISWQYPLVELACGVAFLLIISLKPSVLSGTAGSGTWLDVVFHFVFAALLLIIFTFDLRYYLIPDLPVLLGTLLAAAFRLVSIPLTLADGFWGLLLVAGFFYALYFMSRGRWIGLGDVKLGLFLGMLLGLKLSAVMLALAYFSGALVGVMLVLARRKTMKGELPFGTFLTASTFVAALYGERLLDWYLRLF